MVTCRAATATTQGGKTMINNVINNVGSVGSVGRLVVTRKALVDALAVCKQVVPSKARLLLDNGNVIVESTNIDFGVRIFLEYSENKEQLAFTIPVKSALDFLKTLKSDTVTISHGNSTYIGKPTVTIEDEKGNTATFDSQSVDDFPIIPLKNKYIFALGTQQFIDLFDTVSYAASPYNDDTTRQSLKGCLLILDGTKITTVASDSYRLALNAIEKYTDLTGQYLIYAQAINLALKLLKKAKNDVALVTVELCEGNKHIAIDLGNTQIVSSIIDYPYPDWKSVIPERQDLPYAVSADREQLVQALRTISNDDYFVTFETQGDYLVLKNKQITSKILAVSDVPYSITFRIKYLLDVLERIKADYVSIRLGKDRYHAAVIEYESFKYVVMPVID